MKWNKLGLVWAPDCSVAWSGTHAHLPTPYVLDEQRIRVFFATLDENQFGRLTFVDVSADDPTKVLYEHRAVCLDIGQLGAFDDCGVVPSCAITIDGTVFLYYVGFQRVYRVPYMLFSGLAKSDLNASAFVRHSRCPILDRTPDEPFSRGAPFVMKDSYGLRMWYWSCREWSDSENGVHYNNGIRHARSSDGVHWEPDPGECISPNAGEYSIGRPWVVGAHSGLTMFYSIRSEAEKYRIGCARSADGVTWTRADEEIGIAKSDHGWDSEMVCYPAIVQLKQRTFMFYNGNGHGKTGFGCAELVDP